VPAAGEKVADSVIWVISILEVAILLIKRIVVMGSKKPKNMLQKNMRNTEHRLKCTEVKEKTNFVELIKNAPGKYFGNWA